MEPRTQAARRTIVRRLLLPSLAVLALLVIGCGSTESNNGEASPPAKPMAPADITCPSGYQGGTDGGEYPEENPPEGFETPEQAARNWLDSVYPGSEYVIVNDGLYVLRDDGTATVRAFWLEGREDYLVDAYRACAPAARN